MNWARLLAVFLLAVGLVSEAVPQEAAKKPEAVKPAPSPSSAILGQWNEIGRKLIAMAEDLPEDKYDFKGAPSADGFAQRLIHAAAANYYFINAATGKKMSGEEDPPRTQFANKAALVTYLRKSFADGAAAIQAKGDKGLQETVVDQFAQDIRGRHDSAGGASETS
jgi:hypothetical protein